MRVCGKTTAHAKFGFLQLLYGYLQSLQKPISMNFTKFEYLKSAFLLFGLILMSVCTFAQNESESVEKYRAVYTYTSANPNLNSVEDSGPAVVHKSISPSEYGVYYDFDNRLLRLIELHKSNNSKKTEGPGFRIQIYAGSKMEIASGTKADFVQSFGHDNFAVYQNWQPPHFRVRVGDFLSRQEAMRELSTIRQVFPDAFVVADQIILPKFKKSHIKTSMQEDRSSELPD